MMTKVIQVHYACGHSFPQILGFGAEGTGQASNIVGHLTLQEGQICGPCRETLRRNLEEEYVVVQNDLTTTFERELGALESMGDYQRYSDMLSVEASLVHRHEEVSNLGRNGDEIESEYVIPPTLEDDASDAVAFSPTLNFWGERIRNPSEPVRLTFPYADTNGFSSQEYEVPTDASAGGLRSQDNKSSQDIAPSIEYDLPRFVMDPSPEPGVLTNGSPFTYDEGFVSQRGEGDQTIETDQEYVLRQSVGDRDEPVCLEQYILSSPTSSEDFTLDFPTLSEDPSISAFNPFFAWSHPA